MAKKKKLSSNLVNSVLYIVVGVLFCICNTEILDIILKVAGIVFIVLGVVDLVKEQWMSGMVSIITGAAILVGAWFFIKTVLLILGILLAVKGVLALFGAIKNGSFLGFIFAGLTVAAGVLLAINRAGVLGWLFIVVGVILIVDGVLGFLECLTGKRK